MYDEIERVLGEESKVAERFEKPVWMNKNGDVTVGAKKSTGA